MGRLTAIDWALWTAVTIAAAGAIFALHALIWDCARRRARRSPRCPGCWYDMAGIQGLRCPECGREARSARDLLRFRRSWLRAIIGAALVLASFAYLWRDTVGRNWPTYIPSCVLVRIVKDPVSAFKPGTAARSFRERLVDEIWDRYAAGTLTVSERREIAAREFRQRVPATIVTRRRWPSGTEVRVDLYADFCSVRTRYLTVAPEFKDSIPLSSTCQGDRTPTGFGNALRPQPDRSLTSIGIPPDGASDIPASLEITEDDEVLWTGSVTIPVTVGGSLDEVIKPIDSRGIEGHVRDHFIRSVRFSRSTTSLYSPPINARTPDMAIGLWIEIRDSGGPVATCRVLAEASLPYDPGPRGREVATPSTTPWKLRADRTIPQDLSDPRWTLYVRGDAEAALWDFDATAYWKGEFEIAASSLTPWSGR